ncbi:MaoC family dehydratase [Schinkia azotoformans]|uniref:MaoC family dehydratase n=1 Tax=Schinkia azotoformans TaxID=1454 RepID=UPI000558624E
MEKSKNVKERLFAEIEIGDAASFTRRVTNEDLFDFAALTGDVNPIHLDEDYASKTMFKGRIAHGALTVGFISTLLGTILPGKNVIYLSQNCRFTAPVRIGDTIRVVGKVIDKRQDKKILTIETNVYNDRDELVLEGSAVVMKKEQ